MKEEEKVTNEEIDRMADFIANVIKRKTKESDNWQTPSWLLKHFKNHFDPCPENPEFDGLNNDWKSPSFVNPPYSKPLEWIIKAIDQSRKGVDVILLLRVDSSTEWYKLLMEENCHIAFFNERLRFSESNNSPNFASMLVFLEGKHNHGVNVE